MIFRIMFTILFIVAVTSNAHAAPTSEIDSVFRTVSTTPTREDCPPEVTAKRCKATTFSYDRRVYNVFAWYARGTHRAMTIYATVPNQPSYVLVVIRFKEHWLPALAYHQTQVHGKEARSRYFNVARTIEGKKYLPYWDKVQDGAIVRISGAIYEKSAQRKRTRAPKPLQQTTSSKD